MEVGCIFRVPKQILIFSFEGDNIARWYNTYLIKTPKFSLHKGFSLSIVATAGLAV